MVTTTFLDWTMHKCGFSIFAGVILFESIKVKLLCIFRGVTYDRCAVVRAADHSLSKLHGSNGAVGTQLSCSIIPQMSKSVRQTRQKCMCPLYGGRYWSENWSPHCPVTMLYMSSQDPMRLHACLKHRFGKALLGLSVDNPCRASLHDVS